jgi:hypothetical protein
MEEVMDIISSTDFNVDVSVIYALAAIVIFGIWYYRLKKSTPTEEEKQPWSYRPVLTLLGVALFALGMQYLCDYLVSLIAMAFPQWLTTYETMLDSIGLDDTITAPLVLYSVILAPVCEELAFRGLTFSYARKIMPFWAANLIQAIFFAGMHMNPIQGCYTFVFALFLGYFAEKSRDLRLPVLVHLVFNGIAVLGSELLLATNVNTPLAFFLLLFGSMVVCYGGFELIRRYLPQRKEEENANGSYKGC